MARVIKLVQDCESSDCDGRAVTSILDLAISDDPTEPITLDLDLLASQRELECDSCGRTYYTGDLEIYSEDDFY